MGSTTRYARHSGRPVSGVADGINRAVAVSRENGTAASASTLEWYVAGGWSLELAPPAEAAEGQDSAASGATEAKKGSKIYPENGTEYNGNCEYNVNCRKSGVRKQARR
eukprot:5562578-Pleurochrysis_carterae.AAC.1